MLRRAVHRLLIATGLYDRLELSLPHRIFTRFNNPQSEVLKRAEMRFYDPFVRRGDLVFDVGANVGWKAEIFVALDARVVAVEPDPRNGRILRRRFARRAVEVVNLAVGEAEGTLELYIDGPGSSLNTLHPRWREHAHRGPHRSVPVGVTTLDRVIARLGRPRFLKLDVEGFEREALLGLSCPIETISFEANLEVFRAETLECIDRIASLAPDYVFNATVDVLKGWRFPQWLTAAQLHEQIRAADDPYLEIFARRLAPG